MNNNDLDIYPNPTNSMFAVNSSKAIERIEFFDINNRPLKTVSNQSSMSIGEYPAGLYILRSWSAGDLEPQANLVTIVK